MAADLHLHSSFSGDSQSPMEEMIMEGIRRGLSTLCFTEHMDLDFPYSRCSFELDTETYLQAFLPLKKKYKDQIELLFGVELGLQPHLSKKHETYLKWWPFDFVIGSSHLVHGQDPYDPSFFDGKEESVCYQAYFESILQNLTAFDDVDVYGHIDYVVRYGPTKNQFYSYERYRDILDEILKSLIERGIGLEINTAGFKYGLGHPNPTEKILIRYREMGGELLTIGSDGHTPQQLAFDFHRIPTLLKECGFRYYTVFRGRKPYFYPIETF